MQQYILKFQTSELIPAPYAHAIEMSFTEDFDYKMEMTYLHRDGLSLEDLNEEGFSDNDDYTIEGKLPEQWKLALEQLATESKAQNKEELEDDEDFWEISSGTKTFFPTNPKSWKLFLEEIHQAMLEEKQYEKPLEIQIFRIKNDLKENCKIIGEFKERKLIIYANGIPKEYPWEKLNNYLKNIFSGEFRYEQASKKMLSKNGIFINLGDGFWFELGKSYLNDPAKIKEFFTLN